VGQVSKCSILPKVKKGENFNHRHTLRISRINPPNCGGGLKVEPVVKSRVSGMQRLGKKGHFEAGDRGFLWNACSVSQKLIKMIS
jgi:hypothetical protein